MADEDFHSLIRSEGTQQTRLGSDIESRFWLSYRPYESKNVAREWFIGSALDFLWLHSQDDRIVGVAQKLSSGMIRCFHCRNCDITVAGLAPPECTLGLEWIGTWHIQQAHSSCL